jgi:spindle assembly abnormal protein 6
MWQLDLTEEEFYSVRTEQNLLVDFHNFPYKLIELLQKCLAFPASESTAPFFAQLTVNPQDSTAVLAFIERTSFRQVTQISLKLKSVESDVLKKKLADLLRNYREQISSLQSQLLGGSSYSNQNVNMNMFNTPLSTTITPPSNNNNPTTKTQLKPHVHNLATGALVREKDEACAHLNQLYEVTKEAKTRIEEENSEIKKEFELIKNEFQESQGEVQKANEIITKLQDEVRGLKAKLKSSASIADDQMNAAEQLRASNKRLQTEYAEVSEKAHTAKVTAETLERENKTLQAKIQQLEIFLQQRDSVIAHHQRQSNIKDLDRAIRNLDEPGGLGNGGSVLNFNTASTTGTTNEEPTFESTGYVGSRIFDQTF